MGNRNEQKPNKEKEDALCYPAGSLRRAYKIVPSGKRPDYGASVAGVATLFPACCGTAGVPFSST